MALAWSQAHKGLIAGEIWGDRFNLTYLNAWNLKNKLLTSIVKKITFEGQDTLFYWVRVLLWQPRLALKAWPGLSLPNARTTGVSTIPSCPDSVFFYCGKLYRLTSKTLMGLRTRGVSCPVSGDASPMKTLYTSVPIPVSTHPKRDPPRLPGSSVVKVLYIIHKLYRYRHRNYKYDQLSRIKEINWTVHCECSGGRKEPFIGSNKIFWIIHFILRFSNSVMEGKENILAVAW